MGRLTNTACLLPALCLVGCLGQARPPTLPPAAGEPELPPTGSSSSPPGSVEIATKIVGSPTVAPIDGAVIVRAYLPAEDTFVPGKTEAPNGVLLLRQGDEQNAGICDGFNELPEKGELANLSPDRIIATYWLLTDITSDLRACEKLLKLYDYGRATSIRLQYGLSTVKGPVLLLVESDGRFVAADMSSYTPKQAHDMVTSYFSLIVSQKVELEVAPADSIKLVIAKPTKSVAPAPISPAIASSTAEPATKKKVTLKSIACDLSGKLKGTSTPLDLLGNIGSIFCPKPKPSSS